MVNNKQQQQKSMTMITSSATTNYDSDAGISAITNGNGGCGGGDGGAGTVGATLSSNTNKPKEKRKSNEKRKEKSRDAARCRRSRETEIFTELAHVLPLRREDVEQLDKASVMRLSIAFLKVRQMLKLFPKLKNVKIENSTIDDNYDNKNKINDDDDDDNDDDDDDRDDDVDQNDDNKNKKKLNDLIDDNKSNKLLQQSIDGFLIILSNEGDVTYVSENISEYLGISQIDILGQQIWEYSHQCDHDELKEALNMRRNVIINMNDVKKEDQCINDENHKINNDNTTNDNKNGNNCNDSNKSNNNSNSSSSSNKNCETKINDNLKTAHRDFFIRLKCTLTSRGRSVNIKSASYKVIHMIGHLIMNNEGERILIAIGRPLPHPSNIEIPLGSTTFLTKHSLDMKFTYADDNMISLLGYDPEDLLGKTLYNYHYAADSESLMGTFKSVLSKGQCETNRYRFLGKYGGYSWVITQATVVYDKQKPQSVVCVNYAISNLENDNEIYSCEQLDASNKFKNKSKKVPASSTNPSTTEQTKEIFQHHKQQQQQQQQQQFIVKDTKEGIITIGKLSTKTAAVGSKAIAGPTAAIIRSNCFNPIEKTKISNQLSAPSVKQQQQQQQQQEQITNLLQSSKIQKIDNNSDIKPDLIKCENQNKLVDYQSENSLSPIHRTFNKCSINSVTSDPSSSSSFGFGKKLNFGEELIYHQQKPKSSATTPISRGGGNNSSGTSTSSSSSSGNSVGGPKTVTATVFKKVSIPTTKLNFVVAQSKPQSVTTSVLTPISQLNKIQNNSNNGNNNNNNNNINNNLTNSFISSGTGAAGTAITTAASATINLTAQNSKLFNNTNTTSSSFTNSNNILNKTQQQQQQQQQQLSQQLRTEDMNKGFSMFLDDPTELTMLKEEPDDLQHLAPSAGDACLPLDDSTPLFGEMLDGLILPDTYGTLLSDDINSLDSQHSNTVTNNNNNNNNNNGGNNTNTNNKTHIDPFINYRDESSDTTGSPHLLSPGASKSPEISSIPSLCSPNSLSQDDEFAFMTMNDEIDLTMRAPYIPMNEQEDLPLLTEDLMWSAFSDELHKDIKEALQIEIKNNLNNNNKNSIHINGGSGNGGNCGNNTTTTTNLNSNITTVNNRCNSNGSDNCINHHNEQTTSSLAALLCNGNGNGIINRQQQHNVQQNSTSSLSSSSSPSSLLDQRHQVNSNEISKKRKFDLTDNVTTTTTTTASTTASATSSDEAAVAADLVDTIDAFGQVFNNKNSPNLDCWTINDLLQINPLTTTSSSSSSIGTSTGTTAITTQPSLHSQSIDTKQNIIINAATIPTATFHVPLLAFQQQQNNNNNCGNKINLTRSNSINGSINNHHCCHNTTKICCIGNELNNDGDLAVVDDHQHQQHQHQHHQMNDQQLCCGNKKLNITKLLTTPIINAHSVANSILLNKSDMTTATTTTATTTTGSSTIVHHSCNNKRHLNVTTTTLDSKRVKNSSSIEIQTSPQLLQQLIMAPNPSSQQQQQQQQQQKQKGGKTSLNTAKWGSEGGGGQNNLNNNNNSNSNSSNSNMSSSSVSTSSSSSSSNSVLKNLLISGCDQNMLFPTCQPSIDTIMTDENSLDLNTDLQYYKCQQYQSQLLSSARMATNTNYSKPLQCKISPSIDNNSTRQLLGGGGYCIGSGGGGCGSNPMIGGAGILPSPPIPVPLGTTTPVTVLINNNANMNTTTIDNRQQPQQQQQLNYDNCPNESNRNINSPSKYLMLHSPKLLSSTFNDSDSDSGVECGGNTCVTGTNGTTNFSRNSKNLTQSSMYRNLSTPPFLNPTGKIDIPPNLDLYGDDSMSLSGDEAPPPLEPTEFALQSSVILTPALLSPSSTTTTTSSFSVPSSPASSKGMYNTTNCFSPSSQVMSSKIMINNPTSIKQSSLFDSSSPLSPSLPTFMDTENPLANSSFLMDLCSDDYAMTDLLQDNEITFDKVLDEWNNEMT